MTQPIFKNPFVSSPAVLTGSGNGTLTVDRLTHFTVTQVYTVICTAVAPFTVFKVIGSLDGPVGVAQVGVQFHDSDLKVFLTINQGPSLFVIGDSFTLGVTQGTDLNQENIDTYDALPQKNFSAGLPENVGELAGDDNVRFTAAAIPAYLEVQDLTFTSLLADEDGNDISVKYIDGALPLKASLTIQDLEFEADTAGVAGNSITMEWEDWSPAVNATATIQSLLFEVDAAGAAGNAYSIEYTNGAPTSAPVVSLLGSAITVQIQSGVTTHAQIKTAINTDVTVGPLISAINNVAGFATAPDGPQSFSGGSDSVGAAGSEVVTVVGSAIKVKFQSGVSTATQIKAAVDAYGPAAALINTTIVGTGSTPQIAPSGPTNLAGGQDALGGPGSEIVTVDGRNIEVTFQSGVNTAQDIKDAIDASIAAAALVSVAITGTAGDAQSAPTSRRFLGGGQPAETYALNTNELSLPVTFFDGNGNLIVNSFFAQGRMYVRDDASFRRVVSLDDIDAEDNDSGEAIPNLQGRINQITEIERADRNMRLILGDNWANGGGSTLSFGSTAYIQIAGLTDDRNTLPTSESPIALADGEVAYVEVNRTPGVLTNLSVQVSAIEDLVATDNTFVIARRIGTDIIVGGMRLKSGQSKKLNSIPNDVRVDDEGIQLTATARRINFKGSGVIASLGSTDEVNVQISGVSGSGGGGVTYSEDDGNVDVRLKPPTDTFILESPGGQLWQVAVEDDGAISMVEVVSGDITNIKVTKPDLSEATFAVTDAGELQVISPPLGSEALDDQYFIESPNGEAWRVGVSDDDEFFVESDTTEANMYRVLSDTGQVLHQIQEVGLLALHYLPVFNSTNLPASPTAVTNCMPWAFYDSGSFKRPIYHDGVSWRYFHDNSVV